MDCTWTNFEITTYDIIEQINKGNLFAKNANWKELVRSAVIGDKQKDPLAFCFTLLVNLSDILLRDERVDALHVMEDNMALYLQDMCSTEEQNHYARECQALTHYFKIVRDLIVKYDDTSKFWRENKDRDQPTIEAVIYFICLDRMDADEYLAFVQAHYENIKQSNAVFYPHYAPTHSFLYYNRLVLPNAIELNMAILAAENTRFTFLSKEKPSSFVTIQNVNLETRNQCFDKYIKIKAKQIERLQRGNNNRLYRPTEVEILKMLLSDEKQEYNRLADMREFRGSRAYNSIWGKRTSDVLRMTELFLAYLNDQIRWKENQTNSSETKKDQSVNKSPRSKSQETVELFEYIHYRIVDEEERLRVHQMVLNIVALPKIPQVCAALKDLKQKELILSNIDPSSMLKELRRLGLPKGKGFSDQNFYSAYN